MSSRFVAASIWISVVLSCVVLAFTTASCKSDTIVGPDGSPSDVVFPTSDVSYQNHVQRLFNQTCAISGCHDDRQGQSQLKLTTYENTMFGAGGVRVIIPGDPESSILVFRIEGRISQRMPLNRNPLNQNQINGIRTWIAEGARNN